MRAFSFRRSHIIVDVLAEDVERYVSSANDGIVERLHVEPRAERCAGFLALPVDLAVTDLVAARLSRPRAIPIDFTGDFQRIRSIDVDEEPNALLTRPALRVKTRVDDPPARAE